MTEPMKATCVMDHDALIRQCRKAMRGRPFIRVQCIRCGEWIEDHTDGEQ